MRDNARKSVRLMSPISPEEAMAHCTAFRHQGLVGLNRADGTAIMLTMEEAVAVADLIGPSSEARTAVARHLDAHSQILGSRHSDRQV